jgi:hypothetical protein
MTDFSLRVERFGDEYRLLADAEHRLLIEHQATPRFVDRRSPTPHHRLVGGTYLAQPGVDFEDARRDLLACQGIALATFIRDECRIVGGMPMITPSPDASSPSKADRLTRILFHGVLDIDLQPQRATILFPYYPGWSPTQNILNRPGIIIVQATMIFCCDEKVPGVLSLTSGEGI